MTLIKIKRIEIIQKGNSLMKIKSDYLFNPEELIGFTTIVIPSDIKGPDGEPQMVERCAIDIGSNLVITDHSLEDLMKIVDDVCGPLKIVEATNNGKSIQVSD